MVLISVLPESNPKTIRLLISYPFIDTLPHSLLLFLRFLFTLYKATLLFIL